MNKTTALAILGVIWGGLLLIIVFSPDKPKDKLIKTEAFDSTYVKETWQNADGYTYTIINNKKQLQK